MKTSTKDLHEKMPSVLRALKRSEHVVVSYNGKETAVLVPLDGDTAPDADLRNTPAFGMWRDREDYSNPKRAVRKMRRGRENDV